MVTIITDRLKKQSLDDIGFTDLISPNLIPAQNSRFLGLKENGVLHTTRRLRSQTLDVNSKVKSDVAEIDVQNIGNSTQSCGSFPPSCKKICRSTPELTRAEQPHEFVVNKVKWKPEPSSIWMPKGSSRNLKIDWGSGCTECMKSLRNRQNGAISTPPDSPTPRPSSANAVYDVKWGEQSVSTTYTNSNKINKVSVHKRLSRSRSHPCVTTRRNKRGGIKRPFSEERPALDLDKMEETAYGRGVFQLKGIQIPKCQNKPRRENVPQLLAEQQSCFMLKPIIGSPVQTAPDLPATLDNNSSVMITPSSSPIKEFFECTELADCVSESTHVDEHSNLKAENLEYLCIPDEGIFELDSDLDIDSIEGDY